MGATKGTIKERLELTIRNLQAAGYEGRLERDALAEIERLELLGDDATVMRAFHAGHAALKKRGRPALPSGDMLAITSGIVTDLVK